MKTIYAVLLCLAGISLPAQTIATSVVANAGEVISSASYSISFTLGESFTDTINNSVSIHQGFWAGIEANQLLSTNDFIRDSDSISYFPNPVSDELTFRVSKANAYEILVFSITGQLLFHHRVANLKVSYALNMRSFPKGVYLVQLQISETNKTETFKINKL